MVVLGIDPGLQGGFVWIQDGVFKFAAMPITKEGKNQDIHYDGVVGLINTIRSHIFLERAMPMAMGAKHAFNYGRGFAALEIAIKESGNPVIYVEPAKWTKEMLAGTDAGLKPKVRSQIAVGRLYPHFMASIPKNRNGKMHEGIVDALLIAGYGRRILGLC